MVASGSVEMANSNGFGSALPKRSDDYNIVLHYLTLEREQREGIVYPDRHLVALL
jgi:uncharacterized protein YozE (UPF0346 family)